MRLLSSDRDLAASVNARLAEEGLHYSGRTKISHFLWVLHEDIGEAAAARTGGQSAHRTHGRGVLRLPHHPSARRYGFVDSRNNTALERLAEILGCQPIDYSGRTECCGFHTAAHDERIAIKLTGQHISAAKTGVAPRPWLRLPAVPHRARRLSARNRKGHRVRSSTCRSCTCRSSSAWRSVCRRTN